MSVKGKSKSKQNLEARDKAAARKITMIVVGITVLIVIMLYAMLSNI